jgi:hypothetical protein
MEKGNGGKLRRAGPIVLAAASLRSILQRGRGGAGEEVVRKRKNNKYHSSSPSKLK